MSNAMRTLGFELMRFRPINVVLRAVVGRVRSRLPWGLVHNIPMVGEIELDLPDGRQVVLVSDGYDSLASRVYWSGIDGFEPESLRLFLELLETSEAVLDIGSHVGLYALLAAVDRPDTQVYAFEPVPRNLEYLRANVARNDASNVVVEAAAVGASDGEIVLQIPDTHRLPATATTRDRTPGGAADRTVPTKVDLVSVDGYLTGREHGSIDLIKLDVEGAEADTLRGAVETIERYKPAILCEILHGYADSEAIDAMFQGKGYRFFLVTDDGLIEHEALVGDPSYFYKNYLIIQADDVERRLATPVTSLEDRT